MATAEEKFRGVSGDSTNRRVQYIVTDATDDVDAINATSTAAPSAYDGIPLTNIEVEELSFPRGLFLTTAVYTLDKQEKPSTNDTEISFDVSLTTQHITTSLATVEAYTADANNKTAAARAKYGRRIAVDAKGENPEGIDIRVPIGGFQVTWYAPVASITSAYRKTLMETVGKVNNTAFYGHAAGEVLFTGASGQLRSGEDWQLTYRFEVIANRTNVTIDADGQTITVEEINGWDVLWVKFREKDKTTQKLIVPEQANVERVYYRADFSTVLGI